MAEERRSYLILRGDNILLHTKPVTWDEAEWLLRYAYYDVEDRDARILYLGEWGNVLDVDAYVLLLWWMSSTLGPYVTGIYDNPDEFKERKLNDEKLKRLLGGDYLLPEARQVLEELINRMRKFYEKPVEPKPVDAPVRYLDIPWRHVEFYGGRKKRAEPRPEWYAYARDLFTLYGVSVFEREFWMWKQPSFAGFRYTDAVVVRRDVTDRDLVDAVVRDETIFKFLEEGADIFKQVIDKHEDEMRERGYQDVVKRIRAIIGLVAMLSAGRHKEEEGVPA